MNHSINISHQLFPCQVFRPVALLEPLLPEVKILHARSRSSGPRVNRFVPCHIELGRKTSRPISAVLTLVTLTWPKLSCMILYNINTTLPGLNVQNLFLRGSPPSLGS
ncbi:hypothetical protein RRG08_015538 [Elysia crispata]|uniref:Uncharacterized protein n=1 Tax=Elysia crispata TaxID=231223 RepID=A0AAE0YJ83_9GAST|nr:hypothetical protein RRG08_015538 [Elysia crispata]